MSHALVHILSRKPLGQAAIDSILEPFEESRIFLRYEDDMGVPIVYPEFRWDYYTIHDPPWYAGNIEDCFVLIDPDMNVIARNRWNGIGHVDQTDLFMEHVFKNKKNWNRCHMYEVDIHW